jgi:hypothetical protein
VAGRWPAKLYFLLEVPCDVDSKGLYWFLDNEFERILVSAGIGSWHFPDEIGSPRVILKVRLAASVVV